MEARGSNGHRSNAPTYPGSHTHMLGYSDWEGEEMKRQAILASAVSEQTDRLHLNC